MGLRRLASLTLLLALLVASLIGARLLLSSQKADALPPAGEDLFTVTASVNASSRLGQEVVSFGGTVSLARGEPFMDGGVEVQDITITSLELEGQSLTGPVTVSLNTQLQSTGQLRSLSASGQFPASMFLDVFVAVGVPASPSRTNPQVLRNNTPFHVTPVGGNITSWPPIGVTFQSLNEPCKPLFPALPAEVCVHSLEVTFVAGVPQNPTYSVALDGPSDLHPADLVGLVGAPPPPQPVDTATPGGPTPTRTRTPTPSATPSGPTPTPTVTPTVAPPPDNDDFADALEITEFPFAHSQRTDGATEEMGEDTNLNQCAGGIGMGATVWFTFVASSNGSAIASTKGSLFDTVLAAHSGTSLASLVLLDCSDDTEGNLQSQVSFPISQGVRYYLQAGGYAGARGQLQLNVSLSGGASGGPTLRIPCAALGLTADGCDSGLDGTSDDLNALSFGADYGEAMTDMVFFSVAAGSAGVGGSAVAAQAACSPPQPQADEFSSVLNGTNALVFDGDGDGGACPAAPSLRLVETPESDDLDALTGQSTSFVDPDADGVPELPVYFSLAFGSPTLQAIGALAADVLVTMNDATPTVYAAASQLGLQPGDDIDALCLAEDGDRIFTPGVDRIAFSLAAGSPTLAAIGASAADVLGPGHTVLVEAADLGLQESDDLDALKCLEAAGGPDADGDVNKDGQTTAIDAAIVLQHVAGFVPTINARADVNQDGRVTSVDATLILQRVAGLIPSLPV